MNDRSLSTSLRTVTRLYKEALKLAPTDSRRAAQIAEDARRRLLLRPLTTMAEQYKLAQLLLLLARCEDRISHSDVTLEYAREALQILEIVGNAEDRARAVNTMGIAYWQKGEHATARDFFIQSLETLHDTGHSNIKISALMNLGMISWYLGRYDHALQYLEQSLALNESVNDYSSMCTVLLNLGNVHSNNGDDARAFECYFRGIALLEEHHPELVAEMGMFLAGVGSVFLRAGEYDKSLEYYLRSLAIVEQIGNQNEIATVMQNIGLVMKENNAPEKAKEFITGSLAIREELKDDVGRAVCLVNLASISSMLGMYTGELDYAQQCAELCEASGDKRVLSYALEAVGRALVKLGDREKGVEKLAEGLAVCRDIGYKKGEIDISIELGYAFHALDRDDEGHRHLQYALLMAKESGENPLLLHAHKALAELCEKQQDIAGALEHYKQVYTINNTLFNEKSERRMQLLHVAHQVEEARKEAEIYRLKTEQLEQKVEKQSQEVVAKTMHLSQRSDFLRRVKHMLASALAAPQGELRKSVRQVMIVLDGALADESAWDAFEEQFQQMHSTFTEAMLARWPDLSTVELRVCSLIRLNLSSKEICKMLNIAPRSVDTYRYRIRKKLGLQPDDNLVAFFVGIV